MSEPKPKRNRIAGSRKAERAPWNLRRRCAAGAERVLARTNTRASDYPTHLQHSLASCCEQWSCACIAAAVCPSRDLRAEHTRQGGRAHERAPGRVPLSACPGAHSHVLTCAIVRSSRPSLTMPIPPEAAELANEANSLFVDEDYDTALELYSDAVAAAPTCADLYVARAQVHLKKDDFTSAIADANKAIELDASNSKAYFRKGVACFNMEEYTTAKTAFEKGRELDEKNTQFKTWIRKCNAEIDEEMASEVSAPVPAAVVPPVAAAPAVAPPPPKPVARFRHDFIQTPTHVTVTFYMKGATDDNCQVDFEERALTLDWTISSSDSWQVTFDPLFDAIVPAECTKTCMKVCLSQRLHAMYCAAVLAGSFAYAGFGSCFLSRVGNILTRTHTHLRQRSN